MKKFYGTVFADERLASFLSEIDVRRYNRLFEELMCSINSAIEFTFGTLVEYSLSLRGGAAMVAVPCPSSDLDVHCAMDFKSPDYINVDELLQQIAKFVCLTIKNMHSTGKYRVAYFGHSGEFTLSKSHSCLIQDSSFDTNYPKILLRLRNAFDGKLPMKPFDLVVFPLGSNTYLNLDIGFCFTSVIAKNIWQRSTGYLQTCYDQIYYDRSSANNAVKRLKKSKNEGLYRPYPSYYSKVLAPLGVSELRLLARIAAFKKNRDLTNRFVALLSNQSLCFYRMFKAIDYASNYYKHGFFRDIEYRKAIEKRLNMAECLLDKNIEITFNKSKRCIFEDLKNLIYAQSDDISRIELLSSKLHSVADRFVDLKLKNHYENIARSTGVRILEKRDQDVTA